MSDNIVLITTDLSEESAAGLAQGIQHAKTTNGTVQVLYISPNFDLPLALQRQLNDPESLRSLKESYQQDEKERLQAFLQTHKVSDQVTPVVKFTDDIPSTVICSTAEELNARLIVMASQGKGALGRFFMGSTTQKVVGHSHCPVLIIPPVES